MWCNMYEEILPIYLIFTALSIRNANPHFISSEEYKYYPYELTYKLLTQSQIFTTRGWIVGCFN